MKEFGEKARLLAAVRHAVISLLHCLVATQQTRTQAAIERRTTAHGCKRAPKPNPGGQAQAGCVAYSFIYELAGTRLARNACLTGLRQPSAGAATPQICESPARTGARLDAGQVRLIFYRLSRQIGIRGESASSGPRLHDFRHRFAVETLLRWYHTGEDVRRRLPVLSTYLGHSHVTDTYWYLSNTPELMAAAAMCLEKRWEVHG